MIQCFNYKTRELKIYDSIHTASADFSVPYTTLVNHLYRKTLYKGVIVFVKGDLPEEDLKKFKGIKFQIKNIIDNTVLEFFTIEDIKSYLYKVEKKEFKISQISRAIKLHNKMLKKYYITKHHG